jgi:hypothetical protein
VDLKKLQRARDVLDDRVFKFIKTKGPFTRLMNLVYKPGVRIPPVLLSNSHIMDCAMRDEAILKRSLQRLRKAGRIWCNKWGTPHWEICEGADG